MAALTVPIKAPANPDCAADEPGCTCRLTPGCTCQAFGKSAVPWPSGKCMVCGHVAKRPRGRH